MSDNDGNIKLTIAIPIYNGARYIRDALNSIVSQMKNIDKKIEILVSDNASVDETPQIIKEYQNKYPKVVSYYRNKENIGFDKNVDLAVKRSKGNYVWLLSDDDSLRANSISILFNKVDKYENPSVLLLNYSECDVNLNECTYRIRPDIYEDIYCEDGNIFFQKSKFLFGLISSLVIKKDEWNVVNIEKYTGTDWVHVGAIIEISKNKPSLIISDKMVNFRMGNPRWSSGRTSFYLGVRLVEMFQGMEKLGYEVKTSDYLIWNMYRANLRAILSANAQGLKNKEDVAKHLIRCYEKYPLFWLIHLPLLFVPNIFFSMLRRIKYLLIKKQIDERIEE